MALGHGDRVLHREEAMRVHAREDQAAQWHREDVDVEGSSGTGGPALAQ